MIIDFHTHVFPDRIAEKTIAMLAEKATLMPSTNGTMHQMLDSMDRAGIDAAVVMPIATKPSQTETINRFASMMNASRRIYSYGSLHPCDPNWRAAVDSIKQLGLHGIKLHPEYQDFYVDDPKWFPMYRYAAEQGLPILFHAGLDLGMPLVHCTPERLCTVLRECPELTVIAAHGGGFSYWDEAERVLVGKPIYFDLSMTFGRADNAQLERMVRNHGADQIVFGTDCPWSNQTKAVQTMKELHITAEEREKIFSQTALRLLKRG